MPKPLKILQASAGSGKTFSLAAHYLTLLFSGPNKYREILAVTFTNKATEEMKSRILEVLKGLAVSDSKYDGYKELILKDNKKLNAQTLQIEADVTYRKILHDYSRFAVNTIDGFVQKVIRGFAFELNLDADYSLEMNYDKVKDHLVKTLESQLDENPQLLDWIVNMALDRIANNENWNYKTELLNLVNEIFKEKFQVFEEAIEEIGIENIDTLFQQYIKDTKQNILHFEQTLENYASQIIELLDAFQIEKEQLQGMSRNPILKISEVKSKNYKNIKNIFALIDLPEKWFKKDFDNLTAYLAINEILKKTNAYYVNEIGNYTLANAFNKNIYFLRLMQEIASLLKIYRAENGNLLISDAQKLISGITDDAGDNPSFIWEKVGSKYKNFLFDEFQDTSASQWKSFRSLLSNAMASPSGELIDSLIVGDTKQSIYRWRNGDWNILHNQAKQDIGDYNVIEDSLQENYRSASNIITFNNFLYKSIPLLLQETLNADIQENSSQEIIEWWEKADFNHIITNIYNGASQNLAPKTPQGGTIKVVSFNKDSEKSSLKNISEIILDDVIQEIDLLINEQQFEQKNIALLVRNKIDALLSVEKLMAAGYNVISDEALLIANNKAIQLIINTLKTFTGLDTETTLYKANCIALYSAIKNREITADNYIGLSYKSLDKLSDVLPAVMCTQWETWVQLPLSEIIELLIQAYDLSEEKIHLPYLFAFRDLASKAIKLGEKGMLNFLKWWDEEGYKIALPSPESANAIQVITIHKSKGLAFKAVFLPFCDWPIKGKPNSIFWVPSAQTAYHALKGIPLKYNAELSNSTVAKAYYEEVLYNNMDALNMLYVATTRAESYLYVGTLQKKTPSLVKIGDAINQVLNNEFNEDFKYEMIDHLPIQNKPRETNELLLENYPSTNRLSALYVETPDRNLKHILNIEKSGRRGSILHDVLANANNEADVDSYFQNLILTGDIQSEEINTLKPAVMDVLNEPQLQFLLNSDTELLVEQNIIDTNGKLHRPDKVFITGDRVVILDYKFTLNESSDHIEQVLNYINLYKEMGYRSVQGYLYYALTKKLQTL